MYILGYPILSIVSILDMLLFAYSIIVLAACILSFVSADPRNQLVKIIHSLTFPVFVYCRKYVPSFGNIDLSPVLVFLAIAFLRSGILPIFEKFAQGLIQ